jgi:lipopolysaccharide/colanic/teichoic acid biosynthesis glycosyltransferase
LPGDGATVLDPVFTDSDSAVEVLRWEPAPPARVPAEAARPRGALATKRAIDAVGAAFGLTILSPVFLLVAVLVKATSPGPVLFVQLRNGKAGRRFRCCKFRTMLPDAGERKSELEEQNEMDGPVFKLRRDPRVTRLGRVLRKYSLDELPQLWNVLCGHMSLVGPRPLPVEETASLTPAQRRRLSVKPGMTGLWQISGRCAIPDFNRWVELDLENVSRWSLLLDIKILLKTLPAVISARGAW